MKNYLLLSNQYSISKRVTLRGAVYEIRFCVAKSKDGKIVKKKLYGFDSENSALNAYTEWTSRYCAIQTEKSIIVNKNTTVVELVPYYLESLQNQNKESSIYCKKKIFDRWIIPKMGNLKIKELTKSTLQMFQEKLWQTENSQTNSYYSYQYLSNIRINLSSFLNWVEDRYGYANNMRFIKKPKNLQSKRMVGEVWTKEEFNRFLAEITDQKYRTYFSMLFYTGRRKSEIVALYPTDIANGYITINKTYSRKTLTSDKFVITANKNNKSGISFIPPDLQKEIDKYTPQVPFYFGGEHPMSENAVRNAFISAINRSGVKKIRIHDLRHSFVSRLIHLGATPYVVADLIGDSVEQIYKTYGHMYQKDKIEVLMKL